MCCILDTSGQKIVRMKPFIVRVDRLPSGNVIAIKITKSSYQMVWDPMAAVFDAQKYGGDSIEIGTVSPTAKPVPKTPDNKVVHTVNDPTAKVVAVGVPHQVGGQAVQTFQWTWSDGYTKSFEVILADGNYFMQTQDIAQGRQDPAGNAPYYWMVSSNLFDWGNATMPRVTLTRPNPAGRPGQGSTVAEN